MVSGFVPRPFWLCGHRLRQWVKEQAGKVPEDVEAWIDHLEELAHLAGEVERARAAYNQASANLGRLGKDVSAANLRKIDRARATFHAELLKMRKHLKAKGPALTSQEAEA